MRIGPTTTPSKPAADPAPASAPKAPIDRTTYNQLQRHVDYFDGNRDGMITIKETRQGLRDLGIGPIQSFFSSLVINLGLAGKTGHKTEIEVANIHKAKHDSDTDIYNADGTFSAAKFEELFDLYDKNKSGSMDATEFTTMRNAKKETKVGAFAASQEFGLLASFTADKQEIVGGKEVNALSRKQLEEFYEGSLFFRLAAERKAAAAKK